MKLFPHKRFVKYPKNNENLGAETTLEKRWEFLSKTELKHVIFTFFRRSNVHTSRKIQNPLDLSLIHLLPLVYKFMELRFKITKKGFYWMIQKRINVSRSISFQPETTSWKLLRAGFLLRTKWRELLQWYWGTRSS